MSTKSVYHLYFSTGDEKITFYIGWTDDARRRSREHRNNAVNATHSEYLTYKYQWIRGLNEAGIEHGLEVLVNAVDIRDDNDEYETILKYARANQDRGIKFYDDLPLTNMKAGDILGELLPRRDVVTATQVKAFRDEREYERRRQISYQRHGDSSQARDLGFLSELTRQSQAKSAEKAAKTAEREARRVVAVEKRQTQEQQEFRDWMRGQLEPGDLTVLQEFFIRQKNK